MSTSIFPTFSLLPRFPHVLVGLNLRTGVRSLSAYSHRSDSHPLCRCHFLPVRMCSLGTQAITRAPGTYSHWFDPRSLDPHGHRIICSPCSHSYRPGPLRRGVGAHLFWIASSLMFVDIGFPKHWVLWPSRGLICVRWYGGRHNTFCVSELAMAPTPDLAFNKALFGAGFDPPATGWCVFSIFPWKLPSWIGYDPPIICHYISVIFLGMSDFWLPGRIIVADCWDDSVVPPSSTKLLLGGATMED